MTPREEEAQLVSAGANNRKACPVCASEYMFHIMDVPTSRTRKHVPLFACLACRSMSNETGYVENDAQRERALEWHRKVEGRNRKAVRQLFNVLRKAETAPASVVEIGCGTGVMVDEIGKMGIEAVGFDIDRHSVEYGKDAFGADLRGEAWNSKTLDRGCDLLVCVSVLEHIAQPRPLIAEFAKYCARWGAKAFISVPFLNKNRWKFLLDPDPSLPGTPFFDNDVHITHFSTLGLERCLADHGATHMEFVKGGLWHGVLADFKAAPGP